MFDQVLEEVEEQCREERIPMLGPDKAKSSLISEKSMAGFSTSPFT